MPTIRVKIDKFGNPVIGTEGFSGSACEKATADLEAALNKGADSTVNKRTAEFYGRTERTVKIGGNR